MTARETILRILGDIAPDADLASLKGDRDLREQVELDSFDLLQVLIRISKELGVEIPEADYARIRTLDALTAYVEARRRGLP